MADFEVHIDLNGHTRLVGLAQANRVRGAETILFEYDGSWLADPQRFSLEPAIPRSSMGMWINEFRSDGKISLPINRSKATIQSACVA
jgi:hypothetical protein